MVKPRVKETDQGIQGEFNVEMYDRMMRRLRDRGWLETKMIIQSGIDCGHALEIGPGPGYLGLEWLKKTRSSHLTGLDISSDMIKVAERNAREYGVEDRVEYIESDANRMPFEDETFDAAFSNGSLHEWAAPQTIFDEILRVLKPGGKYCISDLRRDMNPVLKWLMKLLARPKEIVAGFITSVNAAYTVEEIHQVLTASRLNGFVIKKNPVGLVISGSKRH